MGKKRDDYYYNRGRVDATAGRHRMTGNTVRIILDTLSLMSNGENVICVFNDRRLAKYAFDKFLDAASGLGLGNSIEVNRSTMEVRPVFNNSVVSFIPATDEKFDRLRLKPYPDVKMIFDDIRE